MSKFLVMSCRARSVFPATMASLSCPQITATCRSATRREPAGFGIERDRVSAGPLPEGRHVRGGNVSEMHYRSVANLNEAVVRNLHALPRDVDVVVGIPRSGLLAGTMLALAMNVPLADVEGFVAGRLLAT